MNTKVNTDHLKHIEDIAQEDVKGIIIAERQYGSSWRRRGGVGAYMMLCRKFDRIEQQLSKPLIMPSAALLPAAEALRTEGAVVPPYDIFGHAEHDMRPEGIIDDIRDLRRYLLLVEGALRAMGVQHGAHRDNASESVKTCVSAEQAITTTGGSALKPSLAHQYARDAVKEEMKPFHDAAEERRLSPGAVEVRDALLAEREKLHAQVAQVVESQREDEGLMRPTTTEAAKINVDDLLPERRLGLRVPPGQRLDGNRTITEVTTTPRKVVHSEGYDNRPIEKQVPREHGD